MREEQYLKNAIGLFNDSFPPIMDGVALTVRNYAHWLNKANNQVCVVTPHAPNYADNDNFPVYRYASAPVPMRKPYRLGFPNIDLNLNRILQNTNFRLIHAHCPFSSGTLGMRIARQQGVPFIATFHSKYRDDFMRVINNKNIVDLMIKEVISFYEKADEVWVPQEAVKETLKEYGFKGKIEVVENGNDFATNQYLPPIKKAAKQTLNISENETVLLFVGQHIWEKNTRMIIDALSLIKNLPFKMFFIGTGYAEKDLKCLVRDRGLTSKVEFKGIITEREELKNYYAAADLFLFPSLYDNAPLVVREAAALGTPSIMVKNSTAAEIISDNNNGFLIENSAESLACKIKEMIFDILTVKSAGLSASKTIARSWQNIVEEEILDRYSSLIRRKYIYNSHFIKSGRRQDKIFQY